MLNKAKLDELVRLQRDFHDKAKGAAATGGTEADFEAFDLAKSAFANLAAAMMPYLVDIARNAVPEDGAIVGLQLTTYAKGEPDWPEVWRMPADVLERDEGDIVDQYAPVCDDHLLREAVHLYDNILRAPGGAVAVQAALVSAHARFIAGLYGAGWNVEESADRFRTSWLGMAQQARAIVNEGWDALKVEEDDSDDVADDKPAVH